MGTISKYYSSHFVVEKSKLDRLVSLLRERFDSPSSPVRESYGVTHEDNTHVEVESLDALYQLHNSGRKRITDLRVRISDKTTSDTKRVAEISFSANDARPLPSIRSVVMNEEDNKWASATFALMEEQVERCIRKEGMYAVLKSSHFVQALILLCLMIILFTTPVFNQELAHDMWLTKNDVEEITASLHNSSTISQEQHLAILRKQIANLDSHLHSKPWKMSWPIILIMFPLVVIVGAFVYLVRNCYPGAVFLWGDMEERYRTLLKQRDVIWNVIIITTALSIISGLSLMGIQVFLK